MVKFNLTLTDSDAPLHERLAQAINVLIEAGQFKAGDRLPPHRVIAQQAGVAIGTVTKAIDYLSDRGIVRGEVGRGTFVNAKRPSSPSTGEVDLSLSVPPLYVDEDMFVAAAERSARNVLKIPSGGLYDLKGTFSQRSVMAEWLTRTRVDTDPDDLVLCVGAQQAIHMAFSDVKKVSSLIACEAPTFSGAIVAANHLCLELVPVDHDEEGMTPDALDKALAETGCRAVYTVPVCQNPMGFEVGETRRRQILQVCLRHDARIIEDDIYSVHAGKGRLTYKELAPQQVYFLTSLSKCLTPLARVGVLIPPGDRMISITKMLRAEAFGAPPTALEFGCSLIELGADVIAASALRKEAHARTEMAAKVLQLPSVPMPHGAPHLWLPMSAVDAERLARRSLEQGVRVTPPEATALKGRKASGVRLCILAPEHRDDLQRGLAIIAELLNDSSAATIV